MDDGRHDHVARAKLQRLGRQFLVLRAGHHNDGERAGRVRRAEMRAEAQRIIGLVAEGDQNDVEIAGAPVGTRISLGKGQDAVASFFQRIAQGLVAERAGIDHENIPPPVQQLAFLVAERPRADTARLAFAQLAGHGIVAIERGDPGHQGKIIDRLGKKIVSAGFKAVDAVGRLAERGQHHDGDMFGLGARLQPAAGFIAVHAGHHDVEQDDVRLFGFRDLDRLRPVFSQKHGEIFGLQLRLHEAAVGQDVIDDEDTRTHAACLSPTSSSTVARKDRICMGFDR